MSIYPEEMIVFDIYFASAVSMAHCHPGAGWDKATNQQLPAPSVSACAEIAKEMIRVRRKILYEGDSE